MPIVLDLTLIWAGIIAFGIIMYVLLDGFDLGIGILFPWVADDVDRDVMMNSVAPVWDGNETWLVLGGAALFGAFPLAYSVLLPALYLPLMLMLFALILRGVSFEFRFKAEGRGRAMWSAAFALGSTIAAFAQGATLGAFVQGVRVEAEPGTAPAFAGGAFDWFSLFSAATGFAVVFGYALLGASWLIIKTEGQLQEWSRAIAGRLLYVVLFFMLLVSVATPYLEPAIAERWFSLPNFYYLSPVPLLTAGFAAGLWWALKRGREVLPFVCSVGLFLLGFAGLAVSVLPYVVPRSLTIWEAAAPPESQIFLLVGVLVLIPVILGYTTYAYGVFRGKVRAEDGYH
ncbi:MAG: cytochrome d ubiquinol oxidase subunit II [Alphaproteobacteria bacterium]|nr:cytochrome d ubiquinol oxidase subunit II [Alphaproteobacteria bacterium]